MNEWIKLPQRFSDKLGDSTWGANITTLIDGLKNYYVLSPAFFPDYTLHGITHVNMVLELADRLIPDDTLKKLTARDVSVLISSIVLHDIGMFITEDGLFKLIFNENANDKIDILDKNSWKSEWSIYLKKINRYNDQQLLDLFGSSLPIYEPSKNTNELKRLDRLVYGEFIRRQHPRLAHHISLNSFPGNVNKDIFEHCEQLAKQRDIIGLIARSHGMNLRDTEYYIKRLYADDVRPNGIPIFYLMSILRLADYLDAGEHRAPFELEDRQEISISISKKEWKWNQCINIDNYSLSENKDKLTIQASPQNTLDFIKIKNWLNDLQHELDISWAILAEKYDASVYNLSIHRIESNLLNEETRKSMGNSFLTKEAKLSANPNLLKHLIRPLYGDDPSYGVRELIQNAVDACIERQYIEEKQGNSQYTPQISVSIDKKEKIFRIVDNGIGMNEDVLLNYYLSAGSSYRESDDWIKDYTIDKKSQIARTGKFGVGVLSSFLLGESIHVMTRSINDTLGYDFQFKMEQNCLAIQRKTFEIGTTIEIPLSKNTIDALCGLRRDYGKREWTDWFALQTPQISYFINGEEVNKIRSYVPQGQDNFKDWFRYESPCFESFFWQYGSGYNNQLYCNGIAIPSSQVHVIGKKYGMTMGMPNLSITDKLGILSLDLSRSTMLEFPDEQGFIKEAYKYFIAKLLMSNKTAVDYTSPEFSKHFLYRERDYYWSTNNQPSSYVFTESGFSLMSAPFLFALNVDKIILFSLHDDVNKEALTNLKIQIPFIFLPTANTRASIQTYKNIVVPEASFFSLSAMDYLSQIHLLRFWGETKTFLMVKDKLQKRFYYSTQEQKTQSDFRRFDKKNVKLSMPFLEEKLDSKIYTIIAEYAISVKNELKTNLMLDLIKEYLGEDIWIPYRMEDRKKKFPKAFVELKKYMN
ncbi:MAG: ATP-binding protein [Clostridiales bacterium]|nr:ATP-binding protein [Clostridiales bacterium]